MFLTERLMYLRRGQKSLRSDVDEPWHKNYHQEMFDNTTPVLKIEIKVGLSGSLSEIIT